MDEELEGLSLNKIVSFFFTIIVFVGAISLLAVDAYMDYVHYLDIIK